MSFLFDSFEGWKNYCEQHKISLSDSVLEYELVQKGRVREETINGLRNAWQVMKEAVKTGLEENMTSRSGDSYSNVGVSLGAWGSDEVGAIIGRLTRPKRSMGRFWSRVSQL